MAKRKILNIFLGIMLFVGLLALFSQNRTLLFAEQSGGSPQSDSTSRLKTVDDSLDGLGYGSTAAGDWGDWGVMWNRIYSAAEKPFNDAVAKGLWNGTGTGATVDCDTTASLSCYTKAKGGLDDYNNNQTIPSDAYQATWITCDNEDYSVLHPGGNWCNTGQDVAEKQDPNTDLVWSPKLGTSNWFDANNCKYPNTDLPDQVCDSNGDLACQCIKHTGSIDPADLKTGCELYDDGNWRLPTQKELMQSYIDGSWANLTDPASYYWSATTTSDNTHHAWYTYQYYGYTRYITKTTTSGSVRCVR